MPRISVSVSSRSPARGCGHCLPGGSGQDVDGCVWAGAGLDIEGIVYLGSGMTEPMPTMVAGTLLGGLGPDTGDEVLVGLGRIRS